MTKTANIGAWTLFLALLSGCGGGATGSSDASGDVATLPGFGAACPSGVCATGLVCQDSEYAPFPWCTLPCVDVKAPCDKALLGGRNGLCIQMPDGWRGPAAPFCAPTCGNSSQCTPLASGWETCALPAYKQKPLYGDVGKVCQAPSANGQIHVDATTCDWQALITDPKVQDLKGLCASFCSFLTACQFKAAGQISDCCTWQCFQHLTPGGVRDLGRVNDLKCYIQSFDANQQSPAVCTAFVDDCGALCKDDAACDDLDACSLDTCRDWRCVNTPIDGCK